MVDWFTGGVLISVLGVANGDNRHQFELAVNAENGVDCCLVFEDLTQPDPALVEFMNDDSIPLYILRF